MSQVWKWLMAPQSRRLMVEDCYSTTPPHTYVFDKLSSFLPLDSPRMLCRVYVWILNRMPCIHVEYACELVQGGVQTIDRKLLGAKIISTLLRDDIPITYICSMELIVDIMSTLNAGNGASYKSKACLKTSFPRPWCSLGYHAFFLFSSNQSKI